MLLKRNVRYLIYVQILYILFSGLLIEMGLPAGIRYFTDVVNSGLLLAIIVLRFRNKEESIKLSSRAGLSRIIMFIWWFFMLFSTSLKNPSLLRIAWASRNWARFFPFFIACIVFLQREDIERLYRWLTGVYIFDFLLICIQFAVLGHKGDDLGGIFGSMMGGNGQTNILLCIILIMSLCSYFERPEEKKNEILSFFVLFSSMVIAALEELKVFYYEYVLILSLICIVYAVKRQTDRRTQLKIIAVSLLAWLVGMLILAIVFPSHFKVIIGKTSYLAYEAHSSSQYKISRLKFIPQINELFFKDSWLLKLTGCGFGNCEYSKFNFLTSPFYHENWETNYLYFSHQTLYLEGGLIGLGLFTLIFAAITLQHFFRLLKEREVNRYAVLGFVFGLITMINIFYNNATRTEISYLTYFCLASTYIMSDENKTAMKGSFEGEIGE